MRKSDLFQLAILSVAFALPTGGVCAVFGHDDRVPFVEAEIAGSTNLKNASGAISCLDGSWGSGFIVDISEYVDGAQDFYIVATTARVLYEPQTGKSRGRCAFVPAAAPRVHLELKDRLFGGTTLSNADSDDWAYAMIERHATQLESLPIAFGNTYNFRPDIPLEPWTTGFSAEMNTVSISSNCELDDKSHYPSLWRQRDDFSRMVLHSCDVAASSRGGPLAYLSDGQFFAIAINAGDGGGAKFPNLSGVPYDPERGFHNFSRRFDEELEGKLVAFVSRFAHIKDPSPTVQAFSQLVRNVQAELTRLGYDAGPIDGLVGTKTHEAIQAFQTTLNITPNGRVSEELLLLLLARE